MGGKLIPYARPLILKTLTCLASKVVESEKELHHKLPGWRKELLPEEEVPNRCP